MANKTVPPEPDLSNIRKHLRPRPLRRVMGWGGAATIALAAVAVASQTEAGSKRLQLAIANAKEPMHAVAELTSRAVKNGAETERLATRLSELAADRERLNARIAMLERNLADMTGTIKRQNEQIKATHTVSAPPPAPSVPATVPPAAAAAPALTPLAMPALNEPAAAWPPTSPPAQEAAHEAAPPPQAAAPEIEAVPLPPARVAALPESEPAAAAPPAKLEYGIDLGGASNLEALRMHWAAMKANYGPLLVGLRPIASEHAKRPSGVTYRLLAGPLPNFAAAAQLCSRFPATRTGCRAVKFSGVQLAEH